MRVALLTLFSGGVLAASLLAAPPPRKAPARPAKPVAAPQPKVSVAGIKVMTASFREHSSDPGTHVALALEVPAPAGLVDIDAGASTLESLQDSDGRALEGAEFWFSTQVTQDGRAGVLQLRAESVPGPRAATVVAKGTIVATVATGSRTEKVLTVRLQKGATFRLAGSTVTVTEVEDEGEQTRFELKGPTGTMRAVKGLRVLRAGKPLETGRGITSFSEKESERNYRAPVKPGAVVALDVDLWQNPQRVSVPLDVQASIGAPAR
jgi:hypothetical protein